MIKLHNECDFFCNLIHIESFIDLNETKKSKNIKKCITYIFKFTMEL
jgi:hypothetical protein